MIINALTYVNEFNLIVSATYVVNKGRHVLEHW